MPFAIEKSGTVLVCQPQGLINSANAAAFEADLMAQVDKGEQRIVLDLARLDYISSAGLRVVLLLAKKLKQAGGALILCDIQPNVREVFEISGFLAILKVCDTRAEAIAALNQ
ncbi:STAS domain-containing protein [Castellaniella ginsengisoli]|uniref:Anti-sigma factor antagonist n=1 Tax=Castellaniella ginsengisoli TaxID=546114 RepID=A0AB39CLN0_9BURK